MRNTLLLSSLLFASLTLAQPGPGPGGRPPGMGPGPGMGHRPGPGGMGHGGPGMMMGGGPMGIPPPVAAKLGLSAEVTKQVRDASLDANEALITLEADVKRAQLELERLLSDGKVPDEAKVFQKLEAISKAELAVRKNRLGVMLKVRKLLGQETWEKLQAEMPMPGRMGPPPPPPATPER